MFHKVYAMKNIQKSTNYDLEDRLIDFAVLIISISESLPKTRAGNHLAGQIVRSGTAPALIYGEVQAAESRNDFIHKMKIALKELRETNVCQKIIKKKGYEIDANNLTYALKETNELISIFVKSIDTASKNRVNTGKKVR